MKITPIHTRVLVPPADDLLDALKEVLGEVDEYSILAVTSKVVSIWQGRCIPVSDVDSKDELIHKEAEQYIPRAETPGGWVIHTLKNNLLISSAGIDHSNACDYYILWPHNPHDTARDIHQWLCDTYDVDHIGVVITDSHSVPLRRGVVGISLGYAGIAPLYDYRGAKDIFGNELTVSMANRADGIAAAATLVMGEGGETTPAALCTDVPASYFNHTPSTKTFSSFEVPPSEDLFFPLFGEGKWNEGGSH